MPGQGLFGFIGQHKGLIGKMAVGATTVGGGIQVYAEDRARGRNAVMSVGDAVVNTLAWNYFTLPMVALSVAKSAPMINQAYQGWLGNQQRQRMGFYNDGAADTMMAQTSRARAEQAIQSSRLNARSYIGREAGHFASRYR